MSVITSNQRGFTIVELLIVIVVIGILAAITIVAFNGIQNRANDTAVQSDLRSLKAKLEAYKVLNGDGYPDGSTITNATQGFKATAGAYAVAPADSHNLIYCFDAANNQVFAVLSKSKSGNLYYTSESSGVSTLPVSWSGGGTCNTLSYTNNWRGYAAEDTTSGPWRSWTGVTN